MPLCAPGNPVVLIASEEGCVGLVTVIGTLFDDLPSVFFTCNCCTAGFASVLASIVADNVVEFTIVVGIVVPLTVTAASVSKFEPCTVTVRLGVPAVTICGDTWLIVGLTRATTVTPDPQPPLARATTPSAAIFVAEFIPAPVAPPLSGDCSDVRLWVVVGPLH